MAVDTNDKARLQRTAYFHAFASALTVVSYVLLFAWAAGGLRAVLKFTQLIYIVPPFILLDTTRMVDPTSLCPPLPLSTFHSSLICAVP